MNALPHTSHLVAISMPGPFELVILLGMVAVPIAAAVVIVWLLTRDRRSNR